MTLDVTLAEAVPAPQASTPAPQASTPAPQVSTPAPQASTPRPKPPTATAQEAESGAPNAGNTRPVTPAADPGTAVPPTLGNGRAPSRERGSPSREISVDAGTLTNKNTPT